jgi:hypothetical protein
MAKCSPQQNCPDQHFTFKGQRADPSIRSALVRGRSCPRRQPLSCICASGQPRCRWGGCLWVLLKQEPPRQAAELPIAAVPVRRRHFPANAPRPFRAGKGALGLAWWVAYSLIITTRGVAVEIEDTLVDLGSSVSFRGSGRLGSIRGSFGPWEPREFLTALFQDSLIFSSTYSATLLFHNHVVSLSTAWHCVVSRFQTGFLHPDCAR